MEAGCRAVTDNKEEFPPLLNAGFHSMSLGELRQLCVDNFPRSVRRPQIMAGLEKVLTILSQTGLQAEAWVDGSFLTQKSEPDDSDIVIRVTGSAEAAASDEQIAVVEWINATDLKTPFLCHAFAFVEYENGHPLSGVGEWCRAYWIRQFGFSRENEMKGLARIDLPVQP